MRTFTDIVIDSAEAILIRTWAARNRFSTVNVGGAIKAWKKEITLVSRCTLKQQLIQSRRLVWTTHAINSYNAHTRIMLADDGAELDLATKDNDYGDSLAYGLTQHWTEITDNIKR